MPIRKFRSVEEMTPLLATPLAPENLRIAFALSRSCIALHPIALRRGVYKYRSVEEAAAARRRWEEQGAGS